MRTYRDYRYRNMFYFQGGNSIPMVRRYLGVTWALLKISLVVTVYKRRDEMDRNLIDAMNEKDVLIA